MSNNDLKLIKDKILEDGKVGELLDLMGCEYVDKKTIDMKRNYLLNLSLQINDLFKFISMNHYLAVSEHWVNQI